jgi:hypothetical protein
MHSVYKYPIPVEDEFTISMPTGAVVLTVQTQRRGQGGLAREEPNIWALVDPTAPHEPRHFRLAGTGHPIEEEELGRYVGTFLVRDGQLVFHVWEVTK